MKSSLILAVVVLAASVSVSPALAQPSGQVLGTVVKGNTTIVFESAQLHDSDVRMYRAWDQFASEHRDIAQELGRHPKLMSSDNYVARHPELKQLFSENPSLRSAMIENPKNFVLR
jgi:hypothetical protein